MAKEFRRIIGKNSKVYIISDQHGWIKIGWSSNPQKRLMALQSANPHKLKLITAIRVIDAAWVERRIFKLLAKAKRRGEWFNIDVTEAFIALSASIAKPIRMNNTVDNASDRYRKLPPFGKIARLGDKAYELYQ